MTHNELKRTASGGGGDGSRIVGIYAPLIFLKNPSRKKPNPALFTSSIQPQEREGNEFGIVAFTQFPFHYRKNHTNAVCVPSHSQRPAICVPTCTCTADHGRLSVRFVPEASANRPISRIISFCTPVSTNLSSDSKSFITITCPTRPPHPSITC